MPMFKIMAWVMTVAGSVLGLRFLLAGRSLLEEWNLTASDGALVMCRRLGAVYLGLALLFFLGRSAAPSTLRSAVCLGMGGAIALLAGLGLLDLQAGRVSRSILASVVAEAVLAVGFVSTWWVGR